MSNTKSCISSFFSASGSVRTSSVRHTELQAVTLHRQQRTVLERKSEAKEELLCARCDKYMGKVSILKA